MTQRGRKSSDALLMAETVAPATQPVERPDAPYDLNDEQAEEWWAVVNRMPPNWFPRETHGMLAQYCRHVVRGRKVSQMADEMEKLKGTDAFDFEVYCKLLAEEEKQTRTIASLATRMRITQQSTYDPKQKKPVLGTRPWDVLKKNKG
jgi:hypothetical protein